MIARVPNYQQMVAAMGRPFGDFRFLSWAKANIGQIKGHKYFHRTDVPESILLDPSRLRKFIADRSCREMLGAGSFFGLLDRLEIGIYQTCELPTRELLAVGGCCRATPFLVAELEWQERKAVPQKPEVMDIHAGLLAQQLRDHRLRESICAIDWRDPIGSREAGFYLPMAIGLGGLVDGANAMLADVPRLAEAVGFISFADLFATDTKPGYMLEATAYLPEWLLTTELLWRATEDSQLPLQCLFDPLARAFAEFDEDEGLFGPAEAA